MSLLIVYLLLVVFQFGLNPLYLLLGNYFTEARSLLNIGPSEVRAPAVGVAQAGGERSGLY